MTTSITDENHQRAKINIYPTIASDELMIEINDFKLESFELLVSTVNGKNIYQKKILSNGVDFYRLNTKNYPNGVLIISIITNQEILSRKIVIVNKT